MEALIAKYGKWIVEFTMQVDKLSEDEMNDLEYLEERILTHLEILDDK
jgi:hypothetical protein